MLYYMIRLLDFQSNYNILYAVQLNSLKLMLNLRLKFSLRHKQNIQKWEYFGNAFMIYLFRSVITAISKMAVGTMTFSLMTPQPTVTI